MALFVFPLKSINGSNMYNNDDFRQYFANFISTGILANAPLAGSTAFQVIQTDSPSMNVVVGPGVAWIVGGQVMNTSSLSFQVPAPLTNQSRTDSIVIQWSNSSNDGDIIYKQNSTQVVQSNDVYELQICKIIVPANAPSISQSNITDTRADPSVCGFSSPYEVVKTGDLLAQFKADLEANGVLFEEWFEGVKGQLSGRIDDMEQYIAEGKSNVQILLEDMKNYLDEGKGDFQSWVDSVKEIIKSIDPEGKLLAELVDLQQKAEKYLPTGYTFIIEHDSEYQPEVKVTSYKNALGTEVDGFGTGPVFGRERLYNVPTGLSYDRKKIYIEMPKSYTLSGNIVLADDNTLLVIDKPQTLCFKVTNAKISKGYAG